MHWVEVDGIRLPKRIGGHVALDFCNTWAGWGQPPGPRREWLPDYARLVAWARFADLLPSSTAARLLRAAQRRPGEAADVLTSARSLRASLHASLLHPGDARALMRVSSYVREAGQSLVLRPDPSGHARWDFRRGTGLVTPVLAVAHAAAELLTSPDASLVKACPGDDCGWLFIDRRGRRRWCDMSSCGNRAKVRAHAERNK